jgi:hypothetical protein
MSRYAVNDFKGLAIVILAYCIIYLSLLVCTDFMPYAMDNNETWSNLGHAKNLYDYGFSKNKGLADEACEYSGHNPLAHPLVHTHEGNFPRLWATLLYSIGFQSARAQITITTFSIGLLGLLAAYGLTRRVFGEAIALLFCLFMMTDYLLFGQWQVNTWRAWQGLYFFGTLYLAHRIGKDGGRFDRWALLGLLFVAIFYSELVFASFAWMTVAVYSACLCWGKRRDRFYKITATATAGAVMAGAVLATQLISYYGFHAMIRDAYYTVTLRNMISDPKKMAEGIQFMKDKDVLFLQNFAVEPSIHSMHWLFGSIFRGVLGPWSPMFLILSVLGFGGLLIHWTVKARLIQFIRAALVKLFYPSPTASGSMEMPRYVEEYAAFLRNRIRNGLVKLFYPSPTASNSMEMRRYLAEYTVFLRKRLAIGGLWIGWYLLLANVLKDYWFWTGFGLNHLGAFSLMPTTAIGVVAMVVPATLLSWASLRLNSEISKSQARTGSLSAAAVMLVVTAFVVSWYPIRFPMDWKPIWDLVMRPRIFRPMLAAGIIGGAMYLVAHVLTVGDKRFVVLSEKFQAALPLLAAAGAGYLFVWLWSPGYLVTGYLDRCCPIVTYAMYIIPALALWAYGLSARVWCQGLLQPALLRTAPGLSCAAGAAIGAAILMLVFWIRVQAVSMKLLPPTFGRLMEVLESTMFQGKGFAVSNYPVPVAFSAKGWAWLDYYIDENMAKNVPPAPIRWDPDHFWIAEKGKTSSYTKPEFYVFYDQPYELGFAVNRAKVILGREKAHPRYLDSSIVRSAMGLEPSRFQNQLVGKDQGQWGAWAIVKPDQRPIPYLEQYNPTLPLSSPSVARKAPVKTHSAEWPVSVEFVPNRDILVVGEPILQILSPGEPPRQIWARQRSAIPDAENVVSPFAVLATGSVKASPGSSLEFDFNRDVPSGTLYVWQGEQLRVFSRDNEKPGRDNRIAITAIDGSTQDATPEQVLDHEYVRLASQATGPNEWAVSPLYTYLHSGLVPEGGSHWKLWSVGDDGALSLVSETTKREAFHIHREGAETFILSVVPEDANGRGGFEYFSAPFDPGS